MIASPAILDELLGCEILVVGIHPYLEQTPMPFQRTDAVNVMQMSPAKNGAARPGPPTIHVIVKRRYQMALRLVDGGPLLPGNDRACGSRSQRMSASQRRM